MKNSRVNRAGLPLARHKEIGALLRRLLECEVGDAARDILDVYGKSSRQGILVRRLHDTIALLKARMSVVMTTEHRGQDASDSHFGICGCDDDFAPRRAS